MNYQETIEYLYNQLPVFQKVGGGAYKEGLDNSLALDKYFDHPHRKYKTIHVAGTNGKGSTSHTLAAILQKSGYKVGLYTSPHLVDFKERIRVNGQKIAEKYVIDFVAKHHDSYTEIQPSFFELTMMMSFCYFADMDVDVAVIEVGLGGRLDSTNIITPDLSIITNIGLDHVQFLGDSREKIAVEKAGIIKQSIPCIIGEAEGGVRQVFEDVATRVGAPIIFAEDENLIISSQITSNGWIYQTHDYPNLIGELSGFAQQKNTATILVSVNQLKEIGYIIPSDAVYEGFAKVCQLTGLMGRWQIVQAASPRIVCDTAHNAAGMTYIVDQLQKEHYTRLHFVLGMVNDKDISSVLTLLTPLTDDTIFYFTKASIPRAMDEVELKRLANKYGLNGSTFATVKEAVIATKEHAIANDIIYIGGSNFVVAEALELLL